MWCWHHIKENLNGLCPACRSPYADDPHAFAAVATEEVVEKKKKDKKLKKVENKATRISVDKRSLHNVRVIQRNLVYVIGLPLSIASEEDLRRGEFFGQYGRIHKVVVNHNHGAPPKDPRHGSASAYITFCHKDDARSAIQAVDGYQWDGRLIRASFGTTKYCNNFLRNLPCTNPECLYLHELGDSEDRYTREEIQTGASKTDAGPFGTQTVVGEGGPSGTGKKVANSVFPPPVFDAPKRLPGSVNGAPGAKGPASAWAPVPQALNPDPVDDFSHPLPGQLPPSKRSSSSEREPSQRSQSPRRPPPGITPAGLVGAPPRPAGPPGLVPVGQVQMNGGHGGAGGGGVEGEIYIKEQPPLPSPVSEAIQKKRERARVPPPEPKKTQQDSDVPSSTTQEQKATAPSAEPSDSHFSAILNGLSSSEEKSQNSYQQPSISVDVKIAASDDGLFKHTGHAAGMGFGSMLIGSAYSDIWGTSSSAADRGDVQKPTQSFSGVFGGSAVFPAFGGGAFGGASRIHAGDADLSVNPFQKSDALAKLLGITLPPVDAEYSLARQSQHAPAQSTKESVFGMPVKPAQSSYFGSAPMSSIGQDQGVQGYVGISQVAGSSVHGQQQQHPPMYQQQPQPLTSNLTSSAIHKPQVTSTENLQSGMALLQKMLPNVNVSYGESSQSSSNAHPPGLAPPQPHSGFQGGYQNGGLAPPPQDNGWGNPTQPRNVDAAKAFGASTWTMAPQDGGWGAGSGGYQQQNSIDSSYSKNTDSQVHGLYGNAFSASRMTGF